MSEIKNREAIVEVMKRYHLDPNCIAQEGFTSEGWYVYATDRPGARRYDDNGDSIKAWIPNRNEELKSEIATLLD